MPDLTRRQVIRFGAAGAGALLLPIPWTAAARAASAAPPEVRAVDDLALWYDQPAGSD
jgi:alpha-L-fucosidase 2